MNDPGQVRDAVIAQRFVTLADTLVDDYDVVALLDQLVHTIVELLPVDQAGLLLLDDQGQPQLLASTSESTRLLELFQLQSRHGGPCLECLQVGAPISVPDLEAARHRWPDFAAQALNAGFESVHAMPLRLRGEIIGVLNVFGGGFPISDSEIELGQSLADMATISILQQRTTRRAELEAEQLQQALTTRVIIEQAKGVLAEFGSVDMDDAFSAVRAYARNHNLKLADVAAALVNRSLRPDRIFGP